MRTTSEKAQRAIAEAALITFLQTWLRPATLEEIGAQVDLTRGAVLHHFKSKGGPAGGRCRSLSAGPSPIVDHDRRSTIPLPRTSDVNS